MVEAAERLLLIDACCVINLCASKQIAGVLEALPYRCAVARYVVEKEALAIVRDDGEADEREPIELAPMIDQGLLHVVGVDSEDERDYFVRFARHLDDGEAQTCALAVVHRGTVATDDKKALRLLEREGVAALQTPELLHAWADHSGADPALVATTLRRIETLANFRPGKAAPLHDWWLQALSPT